jgi:hypothetical protein
MVKTDRIGLVRSVPLIVNAQTWSATSLSPMVDRRMIYNFVNRLPDHPNTPYIWPVCGPVSR